MTLATQRWCIKKKEKVQVGISNYFVIYDNIDKYTFLPSLQYVHTFTKYQQKNQTKLKKKENEKKSVQNTTSQRSRF